ncbi:hypothetical protein Strop_0131 [Salinispora tropica CNB-440]|uniref:DUF3151 domain-containing protein n=2 Tax=Salinispora tropica TaxID=168695 RepID=A4X166_SALTO|nr:hypothetical protein Strop_0131 [Salinispora tropica CNB-440]
MVRPGRSTRSRIAEGSGLNGAMQNLLPEPPATLLPAYDEADSAIAAAEESGADEDFAAVAARFPTFSAAWAALAVRAFAADQVVQAYAYARTGYHRGLDQLRRSGWKGHGPVPWSHEPNQGFLRCLWVLSRAADAIGEADEAARCAQFLRDCDPAAADALASD